MIKSYSLELIDTLNNYLVELKDIREYQLVACQRKYFRGAADKGP